MISQSHMFLFNFVDLTCAIHLVVISKDLAPTRNHLPINFWSHSLLCFFIYFYFLIPCLLWCLWMSSLVGTYGINCVHILPPSFFILSWSSISFYSCSFVMCIWIFQGTRFLLPFHWMQDGAETWGRELNCSTGWYNFKGQYF